MIQTTIRHSKRYQQIINTFTKNGLSHLLYRIGLTKRKKFAREKEPHIDQNLVDIGVKLRTALQELGPTFIKLGQIASTRRDVVPEAIAKELEKLQDDLQNFSYYKLEQKFKDNFVKTSEVILAYIFIKHIATFSIGQVHKDKLPIAEK